MDSLVDQSFFSARHESVGEWQRQAGHTWHCQRGIANVTLPTWQLPSNEAMNASTAAGKALRVGGQAIKTGVRGNFKKVVESAAQKANKVPGPVKNAGNLGKIVQNVSHAPQFHSFEQFRTMATETLKQQWKVSETCIKNVKSKMLFGLDKLPPNAQQLVHVPMSLTSKSVTVDAVKNAMHKIGHQMYGSICSMSNKIKTLPPKTSALLAMIFGFADVNHTRDEWTQASLTGIINPDSAGFSLPRTLEEFKEGLANAAMDILPDFAFAVPVAMFVANPPAAMLWAGWIAVGEYFAKKSWSLILRDVVLPTKQGENFKKMLEENKLPAKRVFKKEEDAEEDGGNKEMMEPVDGVEEAEESEGKQERVSIKDAIADSQVDSNLYQYLFMNTLRAYFVIGTSIYSYFADEIVKKEEEDLKIKQKTDQKENTAGSSAKIKQKTDKKENTASLFSKWVKNMVNINRVITEELHEEERKNFQALAKEIAHRIIYKKAGPVDEDPLQTTANLISEMSSSPAVLEEMVKVKLGNSTNPKHEKQIEAFKKQNGFVANNAGIQFLPIFNEDEMNELNGLFKKKVNEVIQQNNAVKQFIKAGEQQHNKKREKAKEKWQNGGTAAMQMNVAAKKLSEAGSNNRQRQQNVVTQGASPKGTNPLLKRGESKGLHEVL
uniref:Uncharacterized protein n=1 Tax=Globodera rostochiensis TaxID=31243 RepID=A0A914H3E5_GLORO